MDDDGTGPVTGVRADGVTQGAVAVAMAVAVAEAEAAVAPKVVPQPRDGAPNNARMHPANRYYRQEPDFAALARQYDELRPYVSIDAGTVWYGMITVCCWYGMVRYGTAPYGYSSDSVTASRHMQRVARPPRSALVTKETLERGCGPCRTSSLVCCVSSLAAPISKRISRAAPPYSAVQRRTASYSAALGFLPQLPTSSRAVSPYTPYSVATAAADSAASDASG